MTSRRGIETKTDTVEPSALVTRETVTADGRGGRRASLFREEEAFGATIPPSLYARFEGFRLAGRGGMGAVYEARDIRLDRRVAVKLLTSFGPEDEGLLAEARSQARLRHENACPVYEAGVADEVPFIVMQYLDGEPLDKASPAMTLEQKVRAIVDVSAALHEAHKLGIVHRDVKPSNILVERREDGSYRPCLVDFGIAAEIHVKGRSKRSLARGTPAFMAPEQAEGDARSLDRRTDVYGLGATLYHLLAGEPPFSGGSAAEIIGKAKRTGAPSLRAKAPSTPLDLDAVVMKCLARDPNERYPSARALAEDLERFLAGDLVEARRVSWGARALRFVRRRRGAIALSFAVLALAFGLTIARIRERRDQEARAALERELSEDVRTIELFQRAAYAMPLHDVERERRSIRERLARIEDKALRAGDKGVGLGHEAMGRGMLALGEPRAALTHLLAAERAGHRSPDLDYAAGLALIALHREAMKETEHLQGEAEKKTRIAAIEAEYEAPARARLRASLQSPLASRPYAEGLLALHDGRPEEALVKASTAFREAPWLYEAKALEGRAHFAIGSRSRHDKAMDYARALDHFERALGAYREALDIARSDPSAHAEACELSIQIMNLRSEHGDPLRPSFEEAKRACERAVDADPSSPFGYVKLAWAHNCFAWWVATGQHPGEDPGAAIADAVDHAALAAEQAEGDAMARYLEGAVWRTRALHASKMGEDVREPAEQAAFGYEAAIRIEPDFVWALNELCSVLGMKGEAESMRGLDPSASFREAARRCDRAAALDEGFMPARAGRVILAIHEADHLASMDRSPSRVVAEGLSIVDDIEKKNPAWRWIPYWRARLLRVEASFAVASKGDPEAPLARAEAIVRALAEQSPSFQAAHEIRGTIAAVRAEAALMKGSDPSPALREAREALGRAIEATPWDVDTRVWRAEVELTAYRSTAQRGHADEGLLRAALGAIEPVLASPREDPRLSITLAEIHAARAAARRDPKEAEAEKDRAVAAAKRAIAIHPHARRAHELLRALVR